MTTASFHIQYMTDRTSLIFHIYVYELFFETKVFIGILTIPGDTLIRYNSELSKHLSSHRFRGKFQTRSPLWKTMVGLSHPRKQRKESMLETVEMVPSLSLLSVTSDLDTVISDMKPRWESGPPLEPPQCTYS